jgi:hypothetical protein
MRVAALVALLLPLGAAAAQATQGSARDLTAVAAPSRADSLLAHGRLRAAEEALYAAVAAAPYSPAARGELGRYLASRARFPIAEVLFTEALRFGADTAFVAQALMAIAPYRAATDRRRIPGVRMPAAEAAREAARLAALAPAVTSSASSPADSSTVAAARDDAAEATVAFVFAADQRVIGSFGIRGPGGTARATLDPNVTGLLVPSADDPLLRPQRFGASGGGAPLLIPELWIGARRLVGVEARVDPRLEAGEVRVGLDLLWESRPIFDEVRGTMTLPASGVPLRAAPGATQIPFALAFPGVWLIPAPGVSPLPLESARVRAFLRGARWRFDAAQATVIVER